MKRTRFGGFIPRRIGSNNRWLICYDWVRGVFTRSLIHQLQLV